MAPPTPVLAGCRCGHSPDGQGSRPAGAGHLCSPGLNPRTYPPGQEDRLQGIAPHPSGTLSSCGVGWGTGPEGRRAQAPLLETQAQPLSQGAQLTSCCTSPPSSHFLLSHSFSNPLRPLPSAWWGVTPSSRALLACPSSPGPWSSSHHPEWARWVQAWVLVLGVMQPGPARGREAAASRCEVTGK